jgi:5'-nucleotidase
MRLLVTNDDGIDAPGLAALARVAAEFGEAVVVAPASHHSGCSHRVTTDQPFRVCRQDVARFAVEGTPADCVRVGLHELAPQTDWVLAGINAGGNLGADVYHSGTVAAVREAVLHGRPGIAISQYRRRGQTVDWQIAAQWALPLVRQLLEQPPSPGTLWNVNLPHLEPGAPPPEIVFCPLEVGPLPLQFRRDGDTWHYAGDYHARHRTPGSDVDVCFRGQIAVTRLTMY